MKRILIILAIVVLVVGGLTVPAFSADTGVVNVTADIAQISVTVIPNSVSYGLVPLNTKGLKPIGDPFINAYNTGNCFVDMFIKGDDTTNWALSPSPDADKYVHYFGWPLFYLVYTPLSTSYQDLGTFSSYSPYSGELFRLQMDTPTTSSSMGTQSTTVTVMVTMVPEGIRTTTVEADGPYTQGSSTTLTVTANITDQNSNPVLGLPPANFSFIVLSGSPPNQTYVPGLSAVWTENGGGTYTGSITDISTLPAGLYFVNFGVNDGSHSTSAGDFFDINTGP
jgi:hypothetical protein